MTDAGAAGMVPRSGVLAALEATIGPDDPD